MLLKSICQVNSVFTSNLRPTKENFFFNICASSIVFGSLARSAAPRKITPCAVLVHIPYPVGLWGLYPLAVHRQSIPLPLRNKHSRLHTLSLLFTWWQRWLVGANQFGSQRLWPPIPSWSLEVTAQAAENSLGPICEAPSLQNVHFLENFDLQTQSWRESSWSSR